MTEFTGRCVGGPLAGEWLSKDSPRWYVVELPPLEFRPRPAVNMNVLNPGYYDFHRAHADAGTMSPNEYADLVLRNSFWVWNEPGRVAGP